MSAKIGVGSANNQKTTKNAGLRVVPCPSCLGAFVGPFSSFLQGSRERSHRLIFASMPPWFEAPKDKPISRDETSLEFDRTGSMTRQHTIRADNTKKAKNAADELRRIMMALPGSVSIAQMKKAVVDAEKYKCDQETIEEVKGKLALEEKKAAKKAEATRLAALGQKRDATIVTLNLLLAKPALDVGVAALSAALADAEDVASQPGGPSDDLTTATEKARAHLTDAQAAQAARRADAQARLQAASSRSLLTVEVEALREVYQHAVAAEVDSEVIGRAKELLCAPAPRSRPLSALFHTCSLHCAANRAAARIAAPLPAVALPRSAMPPLIISPSSANTRLLSTSASPPSAPHGRTRPRLASGRLCWATLS